LLCWQPPMHTQAHVRDAMVSWPWVAWRSDRLWGVESRLQPCHTLQCLVRSSAPVGALHALWRVFTRQKIICRSADESFVDIVPYF
jgi:hypothetical protein